MNNLQFESCASANNIYLKSIAIALNGKFYRKYKMDYSEENSTGILSSIYEYLPDETQNPIQFDVLENICNEFKNADENNEEYVFPDYAENPFSFISLPTLPTGKIDVMNYYSAFDDQENLAAPAVTREEFNSNLWSFHLVDFSGIGNSGMPGHYSYNWFKNRAFLSFDRIMPGLLSTLIVILLRYHKTLYQLITEINMYMTDYSFKNAGNKCHHLNPGYKSSI